MAQLDLAQITNQIQSLSPMRRVALGVAVLGSLAFGIWLTVGTGATPYRTLYRGLDEGDASRVVDALAAERIDYRLEEGGTSVVVPASAVYEARIRLAGRGLPGGSGAGFELFDEPRFGTTDFVHRVNYRRALQGELARSIEHLDSVDRARVQIAIPEPSPFVGEEERTPSASVVVRLRAGRELGADRVQGIVHLVSSAVEALEPQRVSVVDETGRLLAPAGDAALGAAAPSSRQRYQNELERELAERVETILGRTVGAGRVVARVRAELDWTQSESTEERFDPNSQIERSERRSSETENQSEGGAIQGGRPGVVANVPDEGAPAGGGGSGQNAERTTETIQYELSKTVRHSVEPIGMVTRLNVAVLLDGQVGEGEGAGDFTPWEPESLEQFEQLARHAVGFSEERGDRITVTNAPFRGYDVAGEAGGGGLSPGLAVLISHGVQVAGLLLGLLLFGKFVVRPLSEALRPKAGEGEIPARLDALEERLVAAGALHADEDAAGSGGDSRSATDALRQADQSLQAIRGWLRET